MGVGHLRRKFVDRKLIGRMSVGQLSAYLMLPLGKYVTARDVAERIGMRFDTVYRYLKMWIDVDLVEEVEYNGNEFRTRKQYRRLFNRITITRSGVLFELVKEE